MCFLFFFANKLVHYAQQSQTSFVSKLWDDNVCGSAGPVHQTTKVTRQNIGYVRFCKPQIYMDVVEHIFRLNFLFSALVRFRYKKHLVKVRKYNVLD